MCVVCTPDKYVKDFLKSKCTNGKVLLALNVGEDKKLHSQQYCLILVSRFKKKCKKREFKK